MHTLDRLPKELKIAIRERDLRRASVLLQDLQHCSIRQLSDDDKAMLADFTARCIDYDPIWLDTAERRVDSLKTTNAPLSVCAHFFLAKGLLQFHRAKIAQHYEMAALHFQELLALPTSMCPAIDERAYGLYSLARSLYKTGEHQLALRTIATLRTTDKSPSELGNALINMLEGWIQFRLNDIQSAKDLFGAAHEIFASHKDWINVGNTLSALGRMERRTNLGASAKYLKDSLKAFELGKATNHRYYGRACRNLARTLRQQALDGDSSDESWQRSLLLLDKAVEICKQCGNHHERADIYNIRASLLLDKGDDDSRRQAGKYIRAAQKLLTNTQDAVLVENVILRSLKSLGTPDVDDPIRAKTILETREPLAMKLKDQGNLRLWARFRVAQAKVLMEVPWCDYEGAEHLIADALEAVGDNQTDYLVREILSLSSGLDEKRKRDVVFGITANRVREIGLDSALEELEASIWRHFCAANKTNVAKTRRDLHIGFKRQQRIEKHKNKYPNLRSHRQSQSTSIG